MILAVQHVPWERMGLIETVLAGRGLSWRYTRPYAGQRLPTQAEDIQGLVIMGGPMSVYEQNRYPYLREEVSLIEDALSRDIPVLGVCLGSQLLALTLGARVRPAGFKEIGWLPVERNQGASEDPIFQDVPDRFVAFHWHGDCFDLPTGTASLLSSDRTPIQGFREGDNSYGLLAHLEVTEEIVALMVDRFKAELEEEQIDGPAILRACNDHLEAMQGVARALFGGWVDRIIAEKKRREP